MSDNQRLAWEKKYGYQGQLWSRAHDDWFEMRDADRVLDLGCGSGKSSALLKGNIVSVDFSMKALKMAVNSVPSIAPVCCDVEGLPFADSSFDFIRASFILGHLSESARERAMQEIVRVLRPGGRFAMEVFSAKDSRLSRKRKSSVQSDIDGDGIYHFHFGKRELENLLSRLEIVSIEEVRWEMRIGLGNTMPRAAIRALAMKASSK